MFIVDAVVEHMDQQGRSCDPITDMEMQSRDLAFDRRADRTNIGRDDRVVGRYLALLDEPNAGGQQSAGTADLIDPALIDQNVKTSICRHKLGLSAPQDSRQ
jgi:hypothetical protein